MKSLSHIDQRDRMRDEVAGAIGGPLDRLMTIEIRARLGGLPPGLVVPMYEICRAHHGVPLSTLAAAELLSRLRKPETVFVCTGAGVPPLLPYGETDGPPGAAALARALALGTGAEVVLLAEPPHAPAVEAVATLASAELHGPGSIRFLPLSPEDDDPAGRLLDRHGPAAVVFVELDGPNRDGWFHGVRGDRRPPGNVNRLHALADAARERGILTIGIGDGGNEVGFGSVAAAIRAGHPRPDVVSTAATDVVVSCSVSNWGAYAVAAAMAGYLGDPRLLHAPERELTYIATSLAAGARDGLDGAQRLAVDGIEWTGHAAIVELMATIVSPLFQRSETQSRPAIAGPQSFALHG